MSDCTWVREQIDDWLDGAGAGLSADDTTRIETHLAACAACRAEADLALRCRNALSALPTWEAPETVVHAAARTAAAHPYNVVRLPSRHARRTRVWVTGAVAAALVLTSVFVWQRAHDNRLEMQAASEAEALEAALALAYVGKYAQHAGTVLRDDVIGLHVVHPVQRAFITSREAVVEDAVVPGVRRALDTNDRSVTSEPSPRS